MVHLLLLHSKSVVFLLLNRVETVRIFIKLLKQGLFVNVQNLLKNGVLTMAQLFQDRLECGLSVFVFETLNAADNRVDHSSLRVV